MNLALLYGAIVCKVISNQTRNKESTRFDPSEEEKIAAYAICTHYSIYYSDERNRKDWISWIKIMHDVEEEGLGAAIKKHETITENGEKVKLTRKEIKKMESKVLQKVQDIIAYTPIFDRLFAELLQNLRNDSANATHFLEEFSKSENSIYDQQTTYRYAWVVHDKDKSCSISPYESLRIVKIEKK